MHAGHPGISLAAAASVHDASAASRAGLSRALREPVRLSSDARDERFAHHALFVRRSV